MQKQSIPNICYDIAIISGGRRRRYHVHERRRQALAEVYEKYKGEGRKVDIKDAPSLEVLEDADRAVIFLKDGKVYARSIVI